MRIIVFITEASLPIRGAICFILQRKQNCLEYIRIR